MTISIEGAVMATPAAAAAAAAAATAEMMARTRKNNAGERSVISDGVLSSGAIITPLPTTTSFVHHKKRSLKGDDEEDDKDQKQDDSSGNNGYIPAFEGYLTIGFSVYVPGYNTDDLGTTTSVDDSLESLIMLFLCSKEVELVISTDPSLPLTPVCPFAEIDSQNTHTGIDNDNNSITNFYGDKMMIWNLPKTTTRTVAFEDSTDTTTSTTDAETDTSTTNSKSKDSASSDEDQQQSQEYYTQWEFTYPVYQWGGSNDGNNDNTNVAKANNEILQDTFNAQVIDTGTLDSLLPWPNALSSSYGNEPYIFWDQTRPPIPLIYNTEIPTDVSIALMYVGGGMIVINTLFALIMNGVLRYCRNRHRLRLKKHQAEMEQRRGGHHGGGGGGMTMEEGNMRRRTKTEYLDTEEGVSAILMESKQYAITKSMRDSMNSTSSGIRSSTSTLRVRNTAATKKNPSSPTTTAKENNLVARAKHHQQEWHSYGQNNNLLGGGSDEDGEDEDLIANC